MVVNYYIKSGTHSLMHQCVIDTGSLKINCNEVTKTTNAFTIKIEFTFKISSFRNHDYTWQGLNSDRIANEFTPKIIKLENGTYIQANINNGVWEINKKNPKILLWKFNPKYSKPITEYVGENSQKRIYQAVNDLNFTEIPALLFSKSGALEISRSKIPFSAIACFTDHCDFDTLKNLKLQRQFFNDNSIKITKGFFINHFSKRNDNASFQNNKEELDLWVNDGHEMCYHSLSQSIKSDEESFLDFKNFKNPYNSSVWIDHGFQPYNFSLYSKNNFQNSEYETLLFSRKIKTLWNYIDAGTATNGVINQLNSDQFTLKYFLKGINSFSLKTKLVMLFKNIIFHYDNDEKRIRNYIDTITHTKNVVGKFKITSLIPLFKNAIPLLKPIFKVLFNWKNEKNIPYKVAKYAPLIFKHTINDKQFYIFQTIEMVDFKKSLSEENINLLIKESGIFIAHTYFSVDMKHYLGKLFKSEGILDEQVVKNFKFLSLNILENKIWNPTLSELIEYFNIIQDAVITCDDVGNLALKNNSEINYRIIQ